jgi:hypothetical protein
LNAISRPASSVGKLHGPRLGIGRRSPCFIHLAAALLRRGFSLLLQFLALAHRLFDSLLSKTGGPLPRRTLASREFCSILLGQFLERLDLFKTSVNEVSPVFVRIEPEWLLSYSILTLLVDFVTRRLCHRTSARGRSEAHRRNLRWRELGPLSCGGIENLASRTPLLAHRGRRGACRPRRPVETRPPSRQARRALPRKLPRRSGFTGSSWSAVRRAI